MQPFVTGAPGRHLVRLPVAAENVNVNGSRENHIGRFDLKVLKGVWKLFGIEFDVDQHFHQGRSWIRRAVHDASPERMPTSGGPQPSGAVQFQLVANSPQSHAVMPYSNWRIISSTSRAPASVASKWGFAFNRRFGFRSHRQAFQTPWNARPALFVIRPTRT